jgi:hypothetical protein
MPVSGYNYPMEFFLTDPNVERLPPADTHLLDLRAEPYPDGKRLRVALEITPFQQKPYLELNLSDSDGNIVTTTNIVEPVAWKLELTLHIRGLAPVVAKKHATNITGQYTLSAVLSYPDMGEIDHRILSIHMPSPTE